MTPQIKLDWAAYWAEFQRRHGGDPVPWRGRLLFRDGWSYSATDHAGPEWKPPAHPVEAAKARRDYWAAHKERVRRERKRLEGELAALTDLARLKDCPLQVTVVVTGEDGKQSAGSAELDLMPLEERVRYLKDVEAEADRELTALNEIIKSPAPAATLPPVRWSDDVPRTIATTGGNPA